MKKSAIAIVVGAVFVAACSSSSGSPGGGSTGNPLLLSGFTPPAPGADQVQVIGPVVKGIPAGGDILWCSYIANPFGTTDMDVTAATGYVSAHGHHAILLAVANSYVAGDSHACNDSDMTQARYLAGASDAAANVTIPDGVGFRIKPGGVIMVQSHFINAGGTVIDGQSAFNVTIKPPDGVRQPAQLFSVAGTQIDLKPRQTGHVVTECAIKEDVQLFDLGGHQHTWGSHVLIERVSAGATTSLYDHPWQPEFQSNPPQNHYEIATPLKLMAGDTLRVTCDFNNNTDADIVFPQEMCVAFGFRFPATADITCVDGVWMAGD